MVQTPPKFFEKFFLKENFPLAFVYYFRFKALLRLIERISTLYPNSCPPR